ncbi:aminotransferase class V-fold PLP-dependent enzyme [Devosia sp.]|uniref:aminotransferase class V-fold PLP-dependent enzyme n=1 Tax=Devosia sp. TaxID=1871048 RepID=UPI00273345B9|nr:aminotransferase class V-fold PLP-dependent enzyme [Devosia sp.]MDP2780052.1 aminotransferase class V-fold PLP-dependent enzyme [Devosia sp.]
MSVALPVPHSQLEDGCSLLDRVRRDPALARCPAFAGPFGLRPLIYADYTASGRMLDLIEDAVRHRVGPSYANTHSEAAYGGRRTGALREAARQSIRDNVGATAAHAVIFAGSGATAGINRLVSVLGLGLPADHHLRGLLLAQIAPHDRPVVLVGPYEHHSNELPWRESLAEVVRIPLASNGQPCQAAIAAALTRYQDRPLLIGAFSAASNVTGIKTDIRPLARLLHRHDGLCVVDYAAGAPYLDIDMGETAPGAGDQLDAIVLSPHKFVGGPGASGLLIADRSMFRITRPSAPGGGTVSFVTPDSHAYLDDVQAREEAGTPSIIGDIRAALVLQLKADMGMAVIDAAETSAVTQTLAFFAAHPALHLLGSSKADRLAIFSFNISAGGDMLHHGLVVAMLNDMFGIQARGGCSCAGPYGHDLLGIDQQVSGQYRQLVSDGLEVMKPGWVRIGFPPVMGTAEIQYVLDALAFIADRGLDLMALYRVEPGSGHWTLKSAPPAPAPSIETLCLWRDGVETDIPPQAPPSTAEIFAQAKALADAGRRAEHVACCALPDQADPLRWFHL